MWRYNDILVLNTVTDQSEGYRETAPSCSGDQQALEGFLFVAG